MPGPAQHEWHIDGERLTTLSRGFDRWISRLSLAVAWLAMLLLIAATLTSVIGRHIRGVNLEPLQELTTQVFFGFVMLSFGYAYLRDGHVRVDIVRERMGASRRAAIELVGCVAVLIPLSAFLTAYGAELAWRAFPQGEWIVKAMVPAGFLLLLLASVSVAIGSLCALAADRR